MYVWQPVVATISGIFRGCFQEATYLQQRRLSPGGWQQGRGPIIEPGQERRGRLLGGRTCLLDTGDQNTHPDVQQSALAEAQKPMVLHYTRINSDIHTYSTYIHTYIVALAFYYYGNTLFITYTHNRYCIYIIFTDMVVLMYVRMYDVCIAPQKPFHHLQI